MNKRSFTITNNIINKSSGNFLKLAQQQGIDDAVAQDDAYRMKNTAMESFNKGHFNNFQVGGPLYKALTPEQRITILNHYIGGMTSGNQKTMHMDYAFRNSQVLNRYNNNGKVKLSKALEILNAELKVQQQSLAPQPGATSTAPTAEGAPGAGAGAGAAGAASTGAPAAGATGAGGAPAAAAAAAAGAGAGAGAGAVKNTPKNTTKDKPSTSPGFMMSPEGKPDPTTPAAAAGAAAPGAAAGAAAAVSTAPATAANALPAATPPAPTGSKPPPPKYFFPDRKTGGIEGFHGPYISPEGKNRYFKTKYDAASRAYLFTGEFEDR